MLLSTKQLSERWGVNSRTILNAIQQGKLKAFLFFGAWKVEEADAEAYEAEARNNKGNTP